MVIPAHIKYIALIILFVLGSVNFTRTAIEIMSNSKRLDNLNDEVLSLRQQKDGLEQEVDHKKTDEYVEKAARNDLNMIKPGEKVYIITQGLKEADTELKVKKASFYDFYSLDAGDNNLKAWLSLFD